MRAFLVCLIISLMIFFSVCLSESSTWSPSKPAVSTNLSFMSITSTMPSFLSLVRPGYELVRASGLLRNVLNRVDLPVLGRPIKAIVKILSLRLLTMVVESDLLEK